MAFHGVDIGYDQDGVLVLGMIDNRFIADVVFDAVIKWCNENNITYKCTKTIMPYDNDFGHYVRTEDNNYHGFRFEVPEEDYKKIMAVIGEGNYSRSK